MSSKRFREFAESNDLETIEGLLQFAGRPGRGRRPTGPESGEARHPKGARNRRMIAEKLDKQRIETRLEALLVVAPPKMLGDLRNAFSSEVRNWICEEISKDLAGLKREEIERQLVDVLRSRA